MVLLHRGSHTGSSSLRAVNGRDFRDGPGENANKILINFHGVVSTNWSVEWAVSAAVPDVSCGNCLFGFAAFLGQELKHKGA